MLVKFIKNCPWSFSLTSKAGRVTSFKAGEIKEIDSEVEAQSMIDNEYAELYVTPPLPAKLEVKEESERYNFYRDSFSLEELKQFCKKYEIYLKSSIQRTKLTIIPVILEFEKKYGQINLEQK